MLTKNAKSDSIQGIQMKGDFVMEEKRGLTIKGYGKMSNSSPWRLLWK